MIFYKNKKNFIFKFFSLKRPKSINMIHVTIFLLTVTSDMAISNKYFPLHLLL